MAGASLGAALLAAGLAACGGAPSASVPAPSARSAAYPAECSPRALGASLPRDTYVLSARCTVVAHRAWAAGRMQRGGTVSLFALHAVGGHWSWVSVATICHAAHVLPATLTQYCDGRPPSNDWPS